MAEALAQTDDAPPPPDELEAETSGELNLRWLPPSDDVAPSSKAGKAGSKRPGLPMDLVLILSLAKAIEAAGGAAPGAPSQITRIEGRSPSLLVALESLLNESFVTKRLMHPGFDIGALHICAPGSDISPRARDDKLRTMFKKITAHMIAGRAAVLVGLGNDPIPDELQPLCAPPLRLSPPDRPLLLALLALHYGKSEEELPVRDFPSDASLAEIPPLVIATALRAESPAAALETLRKIITARPDTSELRDGVIGLDEVAGQPEAVQHLRQLTVDIAQWRSGSLAWAEVPRSLILFGPPGTGKTLLARAFAAEARLPLIATSFAECQKFGHLGDMLAALDAAVSEAERRAPAVFFIDELDGFSTRANSDIGRGGSGYMRAVITGLLRQIDRLMSTPGVVLIAATNELHAIDPAIRRAGRFDATLLIQPPTKHGMAQILRRHLAAADDPELESVITLAAERLVGTSGAEAAALARAALARARGTGADLAQALLAEMDRRFPHMRAQDERRIALHEAGHVVVGILSGLRDPLALRIGQNGGLTTWHVPPLHTHETAMAQIRMYLGGRAAEEVVLGTVSSGSGFGPESDLARATEMATKLELEWGLGDGGLIWHPAAPPILRQGQPWLRNKLDHILKTCYAQARAIIATHRDLVLDLAAILQVERELTGAQLSEHLEQIRQVQRGRHGDGEDWDRQNDVLPLEPD
ncbi:MAG: AAA family ATPase [Paracoccaceae bacterium]|nr:AAA family ATPase [Paracoccaceae bacterium]